MDHHCHPFIIEIIVCNNLYIISLVHNYHQVKERNLTCFKKVLIQAIKSGIVELNPGCIYPELNCGQLFSLMFKANEKLRG